MADVARMMDRNVLTASIVNAHFPVLHLRLHPHQGRAQEMFFHRLLHLNFALHRERSPVYHAHLGK
jgi:hypothetical protein